MHHPGAWRLAGRLVATIPEAAEWLVRVLGDAAPWTPNVLRGGPLPCGGIYAGER